MGYLLSTWCPPDRKGVILTMTTRCLCCHIEVPQTGAQVCASRLLSRSKGLCFSLSKQRNRWHIEMIARLPLYCYPSIRAEEWNHLLPRFLSKMTETELSLLLCTYEWIEFAGRDLVKPGSLSLSLFSVVPTSFLSMQACRGFARTLKWWSVSSQTDSGDSAGPLWLQPFWRYIFVFSSSHSLVHICRRTQECVAENSTGATFHIEEMVPVAPACSKFPFRMQDWELSAMNNSSTDIFECISWADFLQNSHLFVPWPVRVHSLQACPCQCWTLAGHY